MYEDIACHPFHLGGLERIPFLLFYVSGRKKRKTKAIAWYLFLKMGLRKPEISCIMEKDEIV